MQRLRKSLSEKISLLSAYQRDASWAFKVRGQSASVYQQELSASAFSCSCPDHQGKKAFCKHLLFLVARVALQFERAANLSDQTAAWNEETYAACVPSWVSRLAHLISPDEPVETSLPSDKPEGDCPICFEELTEGKENDATAINNTIRCETTCHKWFHRECITRWIQESLTSPTCPMCRAEWTDGPAPAVPAEPVITGHIVDESKEIDTDLVISFDTTGSMYPCLSEVKRHIATMVPKLFRDMPGLRLAIIAHGDYCDGDKVIKTLDFTNDQNAIISFVQTAPSTSGGDFPECYELVLRTVKSFSWRAEAKMKSLVMIGDAPPHEKNENPQKIDWREEAESLANRNIQVFSVQCLNRGNRESYTFYSQVARITNGYHMFLDQFSYITDMLQAICFKQHDQQQLLRFEEDIQRASGGMNDTLRRMFDTMLGKKSRDEVEAEMNPDRFHERYRPVHAAHSVPRARVSTEAAAPSLEKEGELRPCHPSKFQVFNVDEDTNIKVFCEKMGIRFAKGAGYYEFLKPEIIQPSKLIVLMEKSTGTLYEGDVAREIAGIKKNEERNKIKPTSLEKYRIFVQSTSPARKLIGGQGFLYEVTEE
jgi:hypothetical protein